MSAVEIVVIADRSGSMGSIREEAIGGYNAFLQDQQALDGEANLTLVLFDDQYEVPVKSVAIKDVPPLTTETFVPRGFTAMNDAIGKALTDLEAKNPDRAIIVIITDGAENASKEYTAGQVKDKIKAAEDKGWQVQFLAANIDAFQAGGALGISAHTTLSFTADAVGINTAYAQVSNATRSYRSTDIQGAK